ncbi:MAG: alpha/beta fold hydrolase [Bacteroidota bacterium]
MIPAAEAERFVAAIPNAQLCIESGCKHPFQSVNRSPFVDHVITFLQSLE